MEDIVPGIPFDALKDYINGRIHNIEDLKDMIVLMFKKRDVLAQGQRRLFHGMFSILYTIHPTLMISILDLVPVYGYWKDLFHLAMKERSLLHYVLAISCNQLYMDETAMRNNSPISLFAKWVPKEGKSMGHFTKELANFVYKDTDMTFSQKMSALRHRVVALNRYSKTVEVYQCANEWDKIEPSNVPHMARIKYDKALRNVQGNSLRYPDDSKRMICRSKFITVNPPVVQRGVDESRYNMVYQRLDEEFAVV
jgi:hypothetical protein